LGYHEKETENQVIWIYFGMPFDRSDYGLVVGENNISKNPAYISDVGCGFYPDNIGLENLNPYWGIIGGSNFLKLSVWVELAMVIFNSRIGGVGQSYHEKTFAFTGHSRSRIGRRNNHFRILSFRD